MSLFTDDIIVYVENAKKSTGKKILKTSKWVRQGCMTWGKHTKIKVTSYTSNKHMNPEIKNQMPLTTAIKKPKYPPKNLSKCVLKVYAGNYKMLMTNQRSSK